MRCSLQRLLRSKATRTATPIPAIPTIKTIARLMRLKRFIDMFNISQSTANGIFGLSNVILSIGALLVLLGTIGAIWSGGIRERFADDRISSNEAKTLQATLDAAKADAKAAKANERTALAELELNKRRAGASDRPAD